MSLAAYDVPVLQSERLRLRAPTLSDFAESCAMWGDPLVTRFIGGRPSTKEEVWARLLRYIGHWHAMDYGYWVVETAAAGAFVGEVGFGDYRRDIVPSLDGIPEIGWVLAPHAHGKGLAYEAARTALAWRDVAMAPGETVCIVAPEHAASLRIAEKLGFRVSGNAICHGEATVVLHRNSPGAHSDG